MVGDVRELRRCLLMFGQEVGGVHGNLSKASSNSKSWLTQFEAKPQEDIKARDHICVESGKHILKLRDWEQVSQSYNSIIIMKFMELKTSLFVM
jgi:hypothetical protein